MIMVRIILIIIILIIIVIIIIIIIIIVNSMIKLFSLPIYIAMIVLSLVLQIYKVWYVYNAKKIADLDSLHEYRRN